jgi:hypothetical protein
MDAASTAGDAPRSATHAAAMVVTADNFNRAESDRYFAQIVQAAGGVGRFFHRRELEPVEHQLVIRANRDTLYSAAVFDLDAGPVTVTLPDPGGRFMSLLAIDQDQYAAGVAYAPANSTLTREQVGTRYVLLGVRTFVDPTDPSDLSQAQALQDAIGVEQASTGTFAVPNWDAVSRDRIRDALLVLSASVPDTKRMYGRREEVDPVRHLIGSAAGWGGNPEQDATYLTVTPTHNDGTTVHTLTVRDVPVDGFWSITVYNAAGYLEPNPQGAYSINNITAERDADGSVTVQFGGCDATTPNCLPITPGWNYWVRLYRPRAEILDGSWQFPQAQPVP